MKKILLIAATALVALAVNAQQLTTAPATASQMKKQAAVTRALPTQVKLQEMQPLAVNEQPCAPVKQVNPKLTKLSLSQEKLSPMTAPQLTKSVAKSGSVQTTYTGYGTNYYSSSQETWTMYDAYDADGNLYFGDVIPTIIDGSTMYAEYTISSDGTTITIEPQVLATSSTTYYVWLCSYTSDDGSIVLTLGDDGSLTTIDDEFIWYAAFPYGTETFDTTWETCSGYFEAIEDVQYLLPGEEVPASEVSVTIAPQSIYMLVGPSYSGYWYSSALAIIPPYAATNFNNFTTDADSYAWSVSVLDYDSDLGYYEADEVTSTDEDFSFTADPAYVYGPVTLTGTNSSYSDTYSYGIGEYNYKDADLYAYAGYLGSWLSYGDGTDPLIGQFNLDRGSAYYGYLGTPDINTASYNISDLIFYQGTPSAPLYLEGISLFVYSYADNGGEGPTCQIYKVTRNASGSQTLGDLIAESTTTTYQSGNLYQLVWSDFYVYDEDGMTESVDYLFIEDEFTVVFSNWDSGGFSAYPCGEYYGADNGLSTVGIIMDGTQRYFPSLYAFMCVGYEGSGYSYLYTEDETNYEAPSEGGTYTIHVEPYYCGSDDDGNYTTYLYIDDSDDVPDWITLSIADEDYTSDWYFDLAIEVEALDSDTEGRSAAFRLFQPGAVLDITVSQGTATGIDNVQTTVKKSSYGGNAYNLAGQRVSLDTKGIVVRDGKKFINK